MGVSGSFNAIMSKSVEDYPFFKAVLEKNTTVDSIFGIECYVFEDIENEIAYHWNLEISEDTISYEQIRQEMKKAHFDKSTNYDNKIREYIEYMLYESDDIVQYVYGIDY